MVAHTFNLSIQIRDRWISEFDASLGLQSYFQDSKGYTEKPSTTTKKEKKKGRKKKKYTT